MKNRSVVFAVPFIRKVVPEFFDVAHYHIFSDARCQLLVRISIGDKRDVYGVAGKIRLFGYTFAAWAWERVE